MEGGARDCIRHNRRRSQNHRRRWMRPLRKDASPARERQSVPLDSRGGSMRAIRTPPDKNCANRATGRAYAELTGTAQNQAAGRIAANLRRNIRPSDIRQQSQQKERIHRPVKSLHIPQF